MKIGAVMGWTPAMVGGCGLTEFNCAFDAWREAHAPRDAAPGGAAARAGEPVLVFD